MVLALIDTLKWIRGEDRIWVFPMGMHEASG